MRDRIALLATCQVVLLIAGCARQPEPRFNLGAQSQRLKPEFQNQIAKILSEQCGQPLSPKLLGNTAVTSKHMKRGAEIYSRYCVQCHGVNGDGNGVAAQYLVPKPRNYTMGIFKFTSCAYGYKPLREDLIRTVRRGIRGTSMPAFPLLPRGDLEAVVDYVIALSRRGELESKLADQAEFDEKIDEEKLPEVIADIVGKWDAANSQVVYPITPMPIFTRANIDEGKKAFLNQELGCFKCHGEDGRGMLASNVGTDAWGNPTKAADLTSGMLRGGTEPLDIYRHIVAGINGTPMPSFRDAEKIKAAPESIWNLVSYVLSVADIRRRGLTPDSGFIENGMLKPLPGVKPSAEAAAPAPPAALSTTRVLSGPENANRVAAR